MSARIYSNVYFWDSVVHKSHFFNSEYKHNLCIDAFLISSLQAPKVNKIKQVNFWTDALQTDYKT
jgi:hypothetical protein